MSAWTYHGDGILSKVHRARSRDGEERDRRFYYVRYQHEGRRYTAQAGTTEKQARTMLERLDRERREARHLGLGWSPPPVKAERSRLEAELERREAAQRDEIAAAMVWEAVRERFEERHGKSYAKPTEVRQMLDRMGRYLAGRRLDELTRADVQTYID